MSPLRKVLFGSGVFSIGSIGCFGYWVQQKSHQTPDGQKESLLIRMNELAVALPKTMQIEDKYTAKKHIDSVANLSSVEVASSDKVQKEMDKIKTSYYAGYLQEVFQDNPLMSDPVFDYNENLPVVSLTLPGETHKGFVFSGPIYSLHNLKSHQDILNGNYIRCKSHVAVKNSEGGRQVNYKHVDVLITGTTDCRKCNQLKNAILRDAAMVASGISLKSKIDHEDPISDTPVFDCSKKGCDEVGDLTAVTEPAKSKIRRGNFTACNFYTLKKTRLSRGSYKECGAIVAGTTNEDVCKNLHFAEMRKILEKTKNRN
jgi:hypothetical protein